MVIPSKLTLILIAFLGLLAGCAVQAANGSAPYRPTIAASAAAGLSDVQIGEALFRQYLEHYRSGSLNRQERLADFVIHEVRLDRQIESGFVATISFSVKPVSDGSTWVAGNGAPGGGGWVVRKFLFLTIMRDGNLYRLDTMGTGP